MSLRNKRARSKYNREYYLKHRERLLGYHRAYAKANRQKKNEQAQRWRLRNLERVKAANKEYYQRNKMVRKLSRELGITYDKARELLADVEKRRSKNGIPRPTAATGTSPLVMRD